MVKVLQLVHGLSMGGAETIVKDYVLGFDKKKFDVTVLCYERFGSPYETLLFNRGIKTIYACDEMLFYQKKGLTAKIINKLQRYIILRKHIRRICPDIIHFHLMVSSYIRFAKPKKETRLFYTQHSAVDHWKTKHPKEAANLKWLIRHYRTQMIALTQDMRRELNELFGVDNTIVINNGVNQDRFLNAKTKEQMRRELGLPDDSFVIGHVGRFEKVKNHTFLLDIFQKICECNEKARLLLIGTGEMREEIEEKAKKAGIHSRLMILENRTDVPDVMKAMDVFVFPSLSEGLPIVCIEAQLAGLKCVVADTVPAAAKISNFIQYVSLNESAEYWKNRIVDGRVSNPEYYEAGKWDMKYVIRVVEEAYTESMSGRIFGPANTTE